MPTVSSGVSAGFLDAACGAERWETALQAVGEAFDGLACGLRFEAPDGSVSQIWWGLPADFERAYLEHFHQHDPWMPAGRSLPVGRCVPSQVLVPDGELQRSEFYQDLLQPHGLRELVGGVLERSDEGGVTTFAVMRADGAPAFDARDAARLDALLPRLHQATWIDRRLSELEAGTARVAVFVLDPDGKLRSANGFAESLLRSGDAVRSREGRLHATAPAANAALEGSIGAAIPGGPARAVVALPRAVGPALIAVVSPLGESTSRARVPGPRPGVLVLVHDPAEPIDLPAAESVLRRLYGLTAAEARVAALVGSGHSPAETAHKLGITPGTARFQLKRIYARTGVAGQRGLVRLVSFISRL